MSSQRKLELVVTLGLLVLSLFVRIGFFWITGTYGQLTNNDGVSYNQIAASIIAGNGFAWGPGEPTAFRPFGYPWFLAIIYSATNDSQAMLQWVQAFLGGVVVVLTYALARSLGGPVVAFCASLGVTLHPVLVYLAGLTAPEAPALLCQMIALWCAWIICRSSSSKWSAIAGFVISATLGIWFRPELILAVWLFPLAAWSNCQDYRTQNATLLRIALFVTILAVFPPVVRNAIVFGEFIPFPTVGGATFWGANNARATGGWLMPTPENWPDADPPSLGMLGWPGLTESESQTRFYRASLDWMRNNPHAVLRLLPRKLIRSWTLTFADEARVRKIPILVEGLNIAFGLLVLLGVAIAWRKGDRLLVKLLLVPVIAWLIKTMIFYGSARQTALALPVLIAFAAFGLTNLAQEVKGLGSSNLFSALP